MNPDVSAKQAPRSTKRFGRAGGGLLCAGLLLSSPLPAKAETPASANATRAPSERASERYQEGVRAYAAGRYKDAIDSFREADSLAPSAALSYNSALAYDKLLDTASALAHYREYLRREPNAPRAGAVTTRIHELEAELARRGVQQMTLHSDPPGATVVIDDKPLGVTPWMGTLPPGAHVVELRLPGYADFVQRLTSSREHAVTFDFRLARADEPTPKAQTTESPTPTTSQSASSRSFPWPWISLGASAAAFLTAGGFELARESAEKRAKSEPTQIGYDRAASDAESRKTTARVFAGIGGGLAITSVVLLLVAPRNRSERSTAVACDFEGCVGSWGTTF